MARVSLCLAGTLFVLDVNMMPDQVFPDRLSTISSLGSDSKLAEKCPGDVLGLFSRFGAHRFCRSGHSWVAIDLAVNKVGGIYNERAIVVSD